MLRTLVCLFAFSCALIAQGAGKPATDTKPSDGKAMEVTVPSYANTNCPHMPKPAKPENFVDSSHGRVFFCCKNCLAKAKKDPEGSYAKAYPTAKKLDNKTDPIDGKPVKEGVTAVYQGYEINLSDAGHAKAVVANGDIYVTLLSKPEVKDVHNTKDPINDKPVVDNVFAVVGTHLVRLSSAESVEAIKKDPAKAVEKAEKSAKKS
jgi:hypothetical protein